MLNGNNSFYQNMFTSIQNGEGEFLMDTNAPNLVTKDITENGVYNASANNADGYSKVTVDVSGGGGETFEVNTTLATTDTLIVTVDQTFDDVWNAISAGKEIVGTITVDDAYNIPILNCVGTSTTEVQGYRGIYFMYEAAQGNDGSMVISVAMLKDTTADRVVYFAGYGQYQVANN